MADLSTVAPCATPEEPAAQDPNPIGVDPASPTDETSAPPEPTSDGSTRRLLLHATGWYLINRAVTLAAFATAALVNDQRYGYAFASKLGDGRWYLEVARYGYFPTSAPEHAHISIGFFPLLLALIRGTDTLLPGGSLLAASVVCTLAGWAAVVAVGLLAREL